MLTEIEQAIQDSLNARRYEERRRIERRAADTVSHKLLAELIEFMQKRGYESDVKEILNRHK